MTSTLPSIYTFFPTTTLKEPHPSILRDLGRATRRGVKKCSKCGVFNGTRGSACKNKLCNAVFKDSALDGEVGPLNRACFTNLDAVRLAPGMVRRVYSVRVRDRGPDHRGFVQLPLVPENRQYENALCFVDSCQRLFDDSILKCHEITDSHPDGKTGLSCLHIESALKSTSTATTIHLDQENLDFVLKKIPKKGVKRQLRELATEEGPLVQRVSRTVMAIKCHVSPKHPLGYLHFTFGCTKGREGCYDKYHCSCTDFTGIRQPKCVHYYACLCAIASESKLRQEFSNFIHMEFPSNATTSIVNSCRLIKTSKSIRPRRSIVTGRCKDQFKMAPKVPVQVVRVLKNNSLTSWSFHNWLNYVTESINQTMVFENYGNLNSLVFCIPHGFFDVFLQRIPGTYHQDFGRHQRDHFLPSIVYRIMKILHLKEIFDTPEVKLRIAKRFVHDALRGYVEVNESQQNELCQTNFIFFLNVGQSTVDESDDIDNPFVIEWVANVAPISGIGHLKLLYKYGRKST